MKQIVLGIDPGRPSERDRAAWAALTLEPSGTIGLFLEARDWPKAELGRFLQREALLADERLRLIALAAPLTPVPLQQRPQIARLVELAFSRGAFAGAARGPQPPWISVAGTGWRRYQQGLQLLGRIRSWDFDLLTMPPDGVAPELPAHCCAEVYPKLTLAVLLPGELVKGRPKVGEFQGQIDDWLFPQAFLPAVEGASTVLMEEMFRERLPALRLTSDVLAEARRIAGLRRPYSRREPLRAFLAALQGTLALAGAACLVGAEGEREGSYLLPRVWHPDWEQAWRDAQRKSCPTIRRIDVRSLRHASFEQDSEIRARRMEGIAGPP